MNEITNVFGKQVNTSCALDVLKDLVNRKSQLPYLNVLTGDRCTLAFVTDHRTGICVCREAGTFGIKYCLCREREIEYVCPSEVLLLIETFLELIAEHADAPEQKVSRRKKPRSWC